MIKRLIGVIYKEYANDFLGTLSDKSNHELVQREDGNYDLYYVYQYEQ